MDVLFRITLRRTSATIPWGFRLGGGEDFNKPLTILEVFPNSIADNCGLKSGDKLIVLAGQVTKHLTHRETQEVIINAGNVLEVIVERSDEKNEEPMETTKNISPFQTSLDTEHDENSMIKRERNVCHSYMNPLQESVNKIETENPGDNTVEIETFRGTRLPHTVKRFFTPPPSWKSSYISDMSGSMTENIFRDEFPFHQANHSMGRTKYHYSPFQISPNTSNELTYKERKVRFAEPPESAVIELDSIGSRASSIDPESLERDLFYSRQLAFLDFNEDTYDFDDIHIPEDTNSVHTLANKLDKIDFENALSSDLMKKANLIQESFILDGNQKAQRFSHQINRNNDHNNAFGRYNLDPADITLQIDLGVSSFASDKDSTSTKRLMRPFGTDLDSLPTQHKTDIMSEIKTNPEYSSSCFTSNVEENIPIHSNVRDQIPQSRTSCEISFPYMNLISGSSHLLPSKQRDKESLSVYFPSGVSNSQTSQVPSQTLHSPIHGQKLKDQIKAERTSDPLNVGFLAILDRSFAEKIKNWNRPSSVEESATYKLLKEMEKDD